MRFSQMTLGRTFSLCVADYVALEISANLF